jgi:hypothetical protein
MLNSIFELLSEDEMFQIRGGAEVPKPKSRPRDVFDEEDAAVSQQSATTSDEQSLLTFLLNWLKK